MSKCDHKSFTLLFDGKRFCLVCDECGYKDRSFESYDDGLEYIGQKKLEIPLDNAEKVL
jgi:hypothetical protein